MSQPLSVYAVDDDHGILMAVLAALGRPANGFHLAGASTSGEGTAELLAEEAVDIFVCDLRLPDADGLDLLAQAKELRPAMRTVLMTGYPSPDLALRAFFAGVDAILYKPFNADELCDALRATLSGQRVLCAAAARHLDEILRAATAEPGNGADSPLAEHELKVLRLPGTGKTAKEVPAPLALTEATVATYRKTAFKKLGVHKLPEALNKLRGGAENGETARRG